VLNFLNTYSPSTSVQPNEDAALVAPPQEIGDTDWLVPVADDPSKEYIEPVYEYEEGERLADVNDSITMMDNFFARSDELERKVKEGTATEEEQQELKESGTRAEYEEEVRESIAAGSSETGMRKANFMDALMSTLPTSWLMGMGNFFQKAGAVTVDGMESAFATLYEKSPSSFEKLSSAVTLGRYRIEDPEDLANFIADGAGASGEFLETIPVLGNIQGAINTALGIGPLDNIKVPKIETATTNLSKVNAAGLISLATLTPRAKEPATKPEKANIAKWPLT
jgi:hypothetical protein